MSIDWKIHCVKMSVLLQTDLRFNVIFIKAPASFFFLFGRKRQTYSKIHTERKRPLISQTTLKKIKWE